MENPNKLRRNFDEFDDFGQKSRFTYLKDDVDFSFDDQNCSLDIYSKSSTPQKHPTSSTGNKPSLNGAKGLEIAENEKVDRMLSVLSIESDVMSEELLMNENIDFLFEQHSDKHSMVSTSLNYSVSEVPQSTFGTFAFPSSLQQSYTLSQNDSSIFHLNRCETHEPQIVLNQSKADLEPSDRYKARPFTFSEKSGNFLGTPEKEEGVIRNSCEVSFESVKGVKKADSHGESKCCVGCCIV